MAIAIDTHESIRARQTYHMFSRMEGTNRQFVHRPRARAYRAARNPLPLQYVDDAALLKEVRCSQLSACGEHSKSDRSAARNFSVNNRLRRTARFCDRVACRCHRDPRSTNDDRGSRGAFTSATMASTHQAALVDAHNFMQ
jgi:hypothetical protein